MLRRHQLPLCIADSADSAADAESSASAGAVRRRQEIEDRFKWRLERVFADWDAWEAAFTAVESDLGGLAPRRGTLDRSAESLLATLRAIEDVQRRLEVITVYANLRSDEDTRDAANTARRGRAASLNTRFAEAVSWFEPELLALDDDRLAGFVAASADLRVYAHYLDNLRRLREHTLDAEREELLAAATNVTRGAGRIFSALADADLRFPIVRDETGNEVELTHARYSKLLRSRDRDVRRRAFAADLDTYGTVANTLAATMDANVKNHVFRAESRRYPSCRQASLYP
ncbi:MAG: oligoendopeptidase F, partial [Candidatus Krumholzibacteria bacterium]|nr:oligoendopeptidase F [Candidatus Krumholzibacteria bacterium]